MHRLALTSGQLLDWLSAGLSGWLEEQFVRRYLGRNELAYK